MSTVLPPRRQIPPPPPPRAKADNPGSDSAQALSLAARIASLQLNPAAQLPFRNAGNPDGGRSGLKKNAHASLETSAKTFALVLAGLDPDYLSSLLARPPPPIPSKYSQEPEYAVDTPPQLPPRRKLPPKPPSPIQSNYDYADVDRPSESQEYHDDFNQNEGDDAQRYHNPEADSTEYAAPEDETPANGMFPAGACIKCHDFSSVDAHAAQFPRQYVRSLDELAYNLTEPFTYETEKARAIFTWLHHNIQYDAQSFLAGNIKPATPESTLSSGLAVCDGYAGLFVDLAGKAGLQVHRVTGHGKGYGYRDLAPGEPVPRQDMNHAWNCVLTDGEWRLIDACWGAGFLNGSAFEKRFDPSWFTSTPVEFVRRHFPEDPSFQLIADEDGGPLNWEDYILAPAGPLVYGDFYRLGFLVDLLQPASQTLRNGQTVTFTLYKRCEHMTNDERENYVYALLVPGEKPILLQPNIEGGWGLTHRVTGGTELSLVFISTVGGEDAKGIGIRGYTNALNRKAMSFGGLAKWTIV
ncbi:hypothetical protein NP233_g6535 [Leucocoprinus birnbaumii]|uniref:Transglutaminase-like domain-containing protein n=1 Tax=Leucocoprinus birnbaumii TaxID=56174 RepID=A0AAD5VT59_9AGAR|nr:hypothetical protein NP233_g6535 [Leucocoprinus birnbaumii]